MNFYFLEIDLLKKTINIKLPKIYIIQIPMIVNI